MDPKNSSMCTDPNTHTGMSITGNGNLCILVQTYTSWLLKSTLRQREPKVSHKNHTSGLWRAPIYLARGHRSLWPACVREWIILSYSLWSGPVGTWRGKSWELCPTSWVSMVGWIVWPLLHTISPMLCTPLKCLYQLRVSCSRQSKILVLWTASINVQSCSQQSRVSKSECRQNTTPYLWRSSQRLQKNPWVASLPKKKKDWEKYSCWVRPQPETPDMLDEAPVLTCSLYPSVAVADEIFLLSVSMLGLGRAKPWNRSGSILYSFVMFLLTQREGNSLYQIDLNASSSFCGEWVTAAAP